MNDPTAHCDELIQTTADALDSSTVSLMLLAVQTKHLELSVQRAVQKSLEVLAVVRDIEIWLADILSTSYLGTGRSSET